jgi:hypothetical protein
VYGAISAGEWGLAQPRTLIAAGKQAAFRAPIDDAERVAFKALHPTASPSSTRTRSTTPKAPGAA